MMNDMFDSGKIFLVKKPISGRYGLPKMMAQFLVGAFGINACDGEIEETYVVLTTKDRKTLFIFHIDDFGCDLTKRRLFSGKFGLILDSDETAPIAINRQQLKRLVLDGTYDGEWNSDQLKSMMQNFMQATPIPAL